MDKQCQYIILRLYNNKPFIFKCFLTPAFWNAVGKYKALQNIIVSLSTSFGQFSSAFPWPPWLFGQNCSTLQCSAPSQHFTSLHTNSRTIMDAILYTKTVVEATQVARGYGMWSVVDRPVCACGYKYHDLRFSGIIILVQSLKTCKLTHRLASYSTCHVCRLENAWLCLAWMNNVGKPLLLKSAIFSTLEVLSPWQKLGRDTSKRSTVIFAVVEHWLPSNLPNIAVLPMVVNSYA